MANHRKSKLKLPPCKVEFTQKTISPNFRNGNNVNDTAENFIKQPIVFPDCRVIWSPCGVYFCLDNRRLYIYKFAHCGRFLDLMPAVLVNRDKLSDKEKKRLRESENRFKINESTCNTPITINDSRIETKEHTRCNCSRKKKEFSKQTTQTQKSKKNNKPDLNRGPRDFY